MKKVIRTGTKMAVRTTWVGMFLVTTSACSLADSVLTGLIYDGTGKEVSITNLPPSGITDLVNGVKALDPQLGAQLEADLQDPNLDLDIGLIAGTGAQGAHDSNTIGIEAGLTQSSQSDYAKARV